MYLTFNSVYFNVLSKKKATPMRMEFDKLSVGEPTSTGV